MRRPSAVLWLVVALVMMGAFPRLLDWLKEDGQPRTPRAGTLLVAQPDNTDPFFGQTVVLLVEASEQRTWGLVLNRMRAPEGVELSSGVARWGGPIRPSRRVTLVRAGTAPEGAHRVLEGLFWLKGPRAEGLPESDTLTFAGMAAWAPGQLAQELANEGWRVMEGSVDLAFSEPEALWATCAMRSP